MEISVTFLAFKLMLSSLVVTLVSALAVESLRPLRAPRFVAQAIGLVAGVLALFFFVAWVLLVIWKVL